MAGVENSFRDCNSGAIPGCPSGAIAIPYLRMVQKLVTEKWTAVCPSSIC